MALLTAWYLLSTLVISVAVAVLLHRLRSYRAKYVFRLFMLLPVIIPAIVLILLWVFIYDATIGPLNALLIAVGLERWTHAWLGDPRTALYAVMFRNFPWVDGVAVLIMLAGLQAIPTEIVESAKMDGADGLRQLWSIELPLISGQMKLVAILTLIWGVQEFNTVFAMTKGGPINSTQVPGMWMYWNAFYVGKMGYASAIGVIMFFMTLILTILNMRYIRTQEF
jgi:ABC-type sugar transport system permease subunit